jgi:hypothetical protein
MPNTWGRARFLRSYLAEGGALGELAGVVVQDARLSASQKAELLAIVPEPNGLAICGAAFLMDWRRRRNAVPTR